MNQRDNFERGQILVLLALVLLGLLGFTALAIDGGMIYADRRYMQSAADAASLAGASVAAQYFEDSNVTIADFTCPSSGIPPQKSEVVSAAVTKAGSNGITIAEDIALGSPGHDHGVNVTCTPGGDTVLVTVMISQVTNTSFVQLFTQAPMRNTVLSESEANPGATAGGGAAIISTSLECGEKIGGIKIGGDPKVTINTGGMYSNSCVEFNGTVNVEVLDGAINYLTKAIRNGCPQETEDKCQVYPDPTQVGKVHPITNQTIDAPVCGEGAPVDVRLNNSEGTIFPGNYGLISLNGPNSKLFMHAGLYCISDGFTMGEGTLDGLGVTIYYNKLDARSNEGISITGGTITLRAMNEVPAGSTDYIAGGSKEDGSFASVEDMLIYVNKSLPPNETDVHGSIVLLGNGGSIFSGTVYAPSSLVDIGGTANMTSEEDLIFKTSIIGYDVKIHGTANLFINYDKDLDYSWPAWMQLIQ